MAKRKTALKKICHGES